MNAPARSIDLNADLGEGFPNDARPARPRHLGERLLRCPCRATATSILRDAPRRPRARGVSVGAHPGYRRPRGLRPSRAGDLGGDEVERLILDQFDDLAALADEVGLALRFVKPHGALYNQAQREDEFADGVVAAVRQLGPAGAGPARRRARAPGRATRACGSSPRGSPTAATGPTAGSSPGPSRTPSSTTPPRSRPRSSGSSSEGASRPSAFTATIPAPSPMPTAVRAVLARHGDRLTRRFVEMGLLVINPGRSRRSRTSGRAGFREWGVPVGGAFDRGSAALANALVGNPPGGAVLELTLAGGILSRQASRWRSRSPGPRWRSESSRADGRSRPWLIPQSGTLRAGDRLVLGRAPTGARTYLAVRGDGERRSCSGAGRARSGSGRATSSRPSRGRSPSDVPPTRHGSTPRPSRFRILDGPDATGAADWDAARPSGSASRPTGWGFGSTARPSRSTRRPIASRRRSRPGRCRSRGVRRSCSGSPAGRWEVIPTSRRSSRPTSTGSASSGPATPSGSAACRWPRLGGSIGRRAGCSASGRAGWPRWRRTAIELARFGPMRYIVAASRPPILLVRSRVD